MPIFSLEESRVLQVKNISENNFKYWPESATYGYFGGGYIVPALYSSAINRLDFSNETVSTPTLTLSIARYSLAAVSNSN